MSFGIILIVIVLLIQLGRILSSVAEKRQAQQFVTAQTGVGKMSRQWQSKGLPPLQKFHRLIKLTFESRKLDSEEFTHKYLSETSEIEVEFFCKRKPLKIRVIFFEGMTPVVTGYRLLPDKDWLEDKFGIRYRDQRAGLLADIFPLKVESVGSCRIKIGEFKGEGQYKLEVIAKADLHEDRMILTDLKRHLEQGDLAAAVRACKEYCKLSDRNPGLTYEMARFQAQLGDTSGAERSAAMVMSIGHFETAWKLYVGISQDNVFLPDDRIAELKQSASSWLLPGHHGAIELYRERTYRLGIGGAFLIKTRSLVQIQRQAAARMMAQFTFALPERSALLLTCLRIIRAKGGVEKLNEERFHLGEHGETDSFTGLERDRAGFWHLPDLETGDIVECVYDSICREKPPINGAPHFFILNQFCWAFPVYRAVLTFESPKKWSLKYASLNGAPQVEYVETGGNEYQIQRVILDCYEAIQPPQMSYQMNLTEPAVACCPAGYSWNHVVQECLSRNVGDNAADDTLPEILSTVVTSETDPETALEKCFYLVRDKLRYGSFASISQHIGDKDRASKIIHSGIGNCNDKTYLLMLVCKALGLSAELILVATESGLVVEELPADQFNHIFLRAKLPDRWMYLDAAGSFNVYGSPPANLQGFKGLVLNERCEIITLPEDDPSLNKVLISEVFSTMSDEKLVGEFSLVLTGTLARWADEQWKSVSLRETDQLIGAQTILTRFLPNQSLGQYDKITDTSRNNRLEVKGIQERCRLSRLGTRLIGTLRWEDPMLPFDFWRISQRSKVFEFAVPMTIQIEVAFEGDVYARLDDISGIECFTNDICHIDEEVTHNVGRRVVRRKVVIKHKRLINEETAVIPGTLDALERALQVAICLRP